MAFQSDSVLFATYSHYWLRLSIKAFFVLGVLGFECYWINKVASTRKKRWRNYIINNKIILLKILHLKSFSPGCRPGMDLYRNLVVYHAARSPLHIIHILFNRKVRNDTVWYEVHRRWIRNVRSRKMKQKVFCSVHLEFYSTNLPFWASTVFYRHPV